MNRDTTATKTATKSIGTTSKQRAEDVCWSSDWSFIEDAVVASQKPDRSAIAEKQEVANHDETRPRV